MIKIDVSKRKVTQVAPILVCLALNTVSEANAEALPLAGHDENDWRHTLSIYAFLPANTSGTSTIAGTSVPLDLNLKDAVDLLDFAASGRYEVWKGDWGIILDANYVSLGADGSLPTPAGATFNADIRQKWLGLLAAYRVYDGTTNAGNRFAFDVQGGVRYNNLKQEISISAAAPVPTLGGDKNWWEPVIGARGTWEIADDWAVIAAVDLGGFGAGGNDLQASATLGFDWKAWKNTSLFFGYRYFSMDYSSTISGSAFEYDVDQHGPVFGAKFRF